MSTWAYEEGNLVHGISENDVERLAKLANLPLKEARRRAAAELLGAWVPSANELSGKMSAEELREVMPITVLMHPHVGEAGE